MRERPEHTQLEGLSDSSFLSKLLVPPANVRLDWRVIGRYTHSSLFGLAINNKEKSFITLTPGVNVIKLFFFVTEDATKKLERLSLMSFFRLV